MNNYQQFIDSITQAELKQMNEFIHTLFDFLKYLYETGLISNKSIIGAFDNKEAIHHRTYAGKEHNVLNNDVIDYDTETKHIIANIPGSAVLGKKQVMFSSMQDMMSAFMQAEHEEGNSVALVRVDNINSDYVKEFIKEFPSAPLIVCANRDTPVSYPVMPSNFVPVFEEWIKRVHPDALMKRYDDKIDKMMDTTGEIKENFEIISDTEDGDVPKKLNKAVKSAIDYIDILKDEPDLMAKKANDIIDAFIRVERNTVSIFGGDYFNTDEAKEYVDARNSSINRIMDSIKDTEKKNLLDVISHLGAGVEYEEYEAVVNQSIPNQNSAYKTAYSAAINLFKKNYPTENIDISDVYHESGDSFYHKYLRASSPEATAQKLNNYVTTVDDLLKVSSDSYISHLPEVLTAIDATYKRSFVYNHDVCVLPEENTVIVDAAKNAISDIIDRGDNSPLDTVSSIKLLDLYTKIKDRENYAKNNDIPTLMNTISEIVRNKAKEQLILESQFSGMSKNDIEKNAEEKINTFYNKKSTYIGNKKEYKNAVEKAESEAIWESINDKKISPSDIKYKLGVTNLQTYKTFEDAQVAADIISSVKRTFEKDIIDCPGQNNEITVDINIHENKVAEVTIKGNDGYVKKAIFNHDGEILGIQKDSIDEEIISLEIEEDMSDSEKDSDDKNEPEKTDEAETLVQITEDDSETEGKEEKEEKEEKAEKRKAQLKKYHDQIVAQNKLNEEKALLDEKNRENEKEIKEYTERIEQYNINNLKLTEAINNYDAEIIALSEANLEEDKLAEEKAYYENQKEIASSSMAYNNEQIDDYKKNLETSKKENEETEKRYQEWNINQERINAEKDSFFEHEGKTLLVDSYTAAPYAKNYGQDYFSSDYVSERNIYDGNDYSYNYGSKNTDVSGADSSISMTKTEAKNLFVSASNDVEHIFSSFESAKNGYSSSDNNFDIRNEIDSVNRYVNAVTEKTKDMVIAANLIESDKYNYSLSEAEREEAKETASSYRRQIEELQTAACIAETSAALTSVQVRIDDINANITGLDSSDSMNAVQKMVESRSLLKERDEIESEYIRLQKDYSDASKKMQDFADSGNNSVIEAKHVVLTTNGYKEESHEESVSRISKSMDSVRDDYKTVVNHSGNDGSVMKTVDRIYQGLGAEDKRTFVNTISNNIMSPAEKKDAENSGMLGRKVGSGEDITPFKKMSVSLQNNEQLSPVDDRNFLNLDRLIDRTYGMLIGDPVAMNQRSTLFNGKETMLEKNAAYKHSQAMSAANCNYGNEKSLIRNLETGHGSAAGMTDIMQKMARNEGVIGKSTSMDFSSVSRGSAGILAFKQTLSQQGIMRGDKVDLQVLRGLSDKQLAARFGISEKEAAKLRTYVEKNRHKIEAGGIAAEERNGKGRIASHISRVHGYITESIDKSDNIVNSGQKQLGRIRDNAKMTMRVAGKGKDAVVVLTKLVTKRPVAALRKKTTERRMRTPEGQKKEANRQKRLDNKNEKKANKEKKRQDRQIKKQTRGARVRGTAVKAAKWSARKAGSMERRFGKKHAKFNKYLDVRNSALRKFGHGASKFGKFARIASGFMPLGLINRLIHGIMDLKEAIKKLIKKVVFAAFGILMAFLIFAILAAVVVTVITGFFQSMSGSALDDTEISKSIMYSEYKDLYQCEEKYVQKWVDAGGSDSLGYANSYNVNDLKYGLGEGEDWSTFAAGLAQSYSDKVSYLSGSSSGTLYWDASSKTLYGRIPFGTKSFRMSQENNEYRKLLNRIDGGATLSLEGQESNIKDILCLTQVYYGLATVDEKQQTDSNYGTTVMGKTSNDSPIAALEKTINVIQGRVTSLWRLVKTNVAQLCGTNKEASKILGLVTGDWSNTYYRFFEYGESLMNASHKDSMDVGYTIMQTDYTKALAATGGTPWNDDDSAYLATNQHCSGIKWNSDGVGEPANPAVSITYGPYAGNFENPGCCSYDDFTYNSLGKLSLNRSTLDSVNSGIDELVCPASNDDMCVVWAGGEHPVSDAFTGDYGLNGRIKAFRKCYMISDYKEIKEPIYEDSDGDGKDDKVSNPEESAGYVYKDGLTEKDMPNVNDFIRNNGKEISGNAYVNDDSVSVNPETGAAGNFILRYYADDNTEYQVIIHRQCAGGHTGYYCGGHLSLIDNNSILGITNEEKKIVQDNTTDENAEARQDMLGKIGTIDDRTKDGTEYSGNQVVNGGYIYDGDGNLYMKNVTGYDADGNFIDSGNTQYARYYNPSWNFTNKLNSKFSSFLSSGGTTNPIQMICLSFNMLEKNYYEKNKIPTPSDLDEVMAYVPTADSVLMERAKDIFDVDTALSHTFIKADWTGWTADNMTIAALMYTQDWDDLYGWEPKGYIGSDEYKNYIQSLPVESQDKIASSTNYAQQFSEDKAMAMINRFRDAGNDIPDGSKAYHTILQGLSYCGRMGYSKETRNGEYSQFYLKLKSGKIPEFGWNVTSTGTSDCSSFASAIAGLPESSVLGFLGKAKTRPLGDGGAKPGDVILVNKVSGGYPYHALVFCGWVDTSHTSMYCLQCTSDGTEGSMLSIKPYGEENVYRHAGTVKKLYYYPVD